MPRKETEIGGRYGNRDIKRTGCLKGAGKSSIDFYVTEKSTRL